MKKLVTNIAFLGFLGLFSINSSAQNVAVVDVELALLASQEVQDARKALSEEPEFAALIEEAEKLQIELQDLIEKSQKDEEIMSDDEKAELAKEFEEKSTDYEFLMGKIQTKEAEMLQEIFAQRLPLANQILNELVVAKKIGILLNSSRQTNPNLLFADSSIDLTSLVTDSLDAIQAEEVVEDSE